MIEFVLEIFEGNHQGSHVKVEEMSFPMAFSNTFQRPRPSQAKISTLQPETDKSFENSAEYISQMAAELARIAKASHLDLIAYFLEMAQLEAENACRSEISTRDRAQAKK